MLATSKNQNTLIAVDDFVQHQQTGHIGKVVGYGHQMIDGVYLPTLIVKLSETTGTYQTGFVEDLSSAWMWLEAKQSLQAA